MSDTRTGAAASATHCNLLSRSWRYTISSSRWDDTMVSCAESSWSLSGTRVACVRVCLALADATTTEHAHLVARRQPVAVLCQLLQRPAKLVAGVLRVWGQTGHSAAASEPHVAPPCLSHRLGYTQRTLASSRYWARNASCDSNNRWVAPARQYSTTPGPHAFSTAPRRPAAARFDLWTAAVQAASRGWLAVGRGGHHRQAGDESRGTGACGV